MTSIDHIFWWLGCVLCVSTGVCIVGYIMGYAANHLIVSVKDVWASCWIRKAIMEKREREKSK